MAYLTPKSLSPFYNHFSIIWNLGKRLIQSTHLLFELQIQPFNSKFINFHKFFDKILNQNE